MKVPPCSLPILQSARLLLTPMGSHGGDAADMRRYLNSFTPELKAATGYHRHSYWDQPTAERLMAEEKAMIESGLACCWGIRLKTDPDRKLIGDVSYYVIMAKPGHYSRGFSLDAALHNNGIMSEAVRLTLDYMFSNKMTMLTSANDVSNTASSLIKYRSGAKLVEYYLRHDRHNNTVNTAERWVLTKESWLKHPDCALSHQENTAPIAKTRRKRTAMPAQLAPVAA